MSSYLQTSTECATLNPTTSAPSYADYFYNSERVIAHEAINSFSRVTSVLGDRVLTRIIPTPVVHNGIRGVKLIVDASMYQKVATRPLRFRKCKAAKPLTKSAFVRHLDSIKPRYDTHDFVNKPTSFRCFDRNYFGTPCRLTPRAPPHKEFQSKLRWTLGQTDAEYSQFLNREQYDVFTDALRVILSRVPDTTPHVFKTLRRSPTKLAFNRVEQIASMDGIPETPGTLPIVSRLPDDETYQPNQRASYSYNADGALYYVLNKADYYTYYHQDAWAVFTAPRHFPVDPLPAHIAKYSPDPLAAVPGSFELTPPLAVNPRLYVRNSPSFPDNRDSSDSEDEDDDDTIYDLIPGFTWARKFLKTLKSTGNSMLRTMVSWMIKPLAKFLLGNLSANFSTYFSKNIKNIILSMSLLVITFALGYTATSSLMAGLFGAVGAFFLSQAAVNITELVSLATRMLELLTNNTHVPGLSMNGPSEFASASFDLLTQFMSICGVHFIYFTEKIHSSWLRVRSLQDFGAFILEMMPMVVQDLIYQYAPHQAVMMMYRNSGYNQYMNQMQALTEQMKMNYTDDLGAQFSDVHSRAGKYLSTQMGTGWFRTAKQHLDDQHMIYTRLRQQMNNHNGCRPFMVQIGGPHNLAKSRIITQLADQANSIVCGYRKIGAYFTRPTGEYWEGYAKEPVMVYKEFIGQSEEDNCRDVGEWCGLYDGAYKPNYAFAPKGTSVEMSAVYAATNFMFPLKIYNQNNLESYRRKRDLCIMAHPAPEVAHLFGTPEWAGYLAGLPDASKTAFSAFRYSFVHPLDPDSVAAFPGIPNLNYKQKFTADKLMDYHAHLLRTFLVENKREFGITAGLLGASLDRLGIPENPLSIKGPTDPEKFELTIALKFFMKHIAPYLALASTITAILVATRKHQKKHVDNIEEVHSVPASRLRGKALRNIKPKERIGVVQAVDEANQIAPQLARIQSQICSLRVNDKHIIYGFLATDNTLLCNAHFFRVADQFVTKRFTMVFANGLTFAQVFEPHMANYRTFRMGDKHLICDSVIIKLTMPIPTMKDLTKLFINDYVTPTKVYRVSPSEYWHLDATGRCAGSVTYDDEHIMAKHLVTDRPLRYSFNSNKGDCGMLILSELHGRLICHGIHTGSTGNQSYVNSVLLKQFIYAPTRYEPIANIEGIILDEEEKCVVPVGQFSMLGTNAKYVKTPMDTQLKRTIFPDDADVAISPKSKAILFAREARFGRVNVWPVLSVVHDYATIVTVEEYLRGLPFYHGSRVTMTPEDAVASLDPTTSVGYGWSKKRSLLTPPGPITGWDPEFARQFNLLQSKVFGGIYPWAVLVCCLKDEAMSKEKAGIKKTRTFQISPYQWNILGKMLYGDFMQYMSTSHKYIPSTIGMDPNTSEFHDMFQELLDHSASMFDGDYSAFETLVVPPSIEAWLKMADAFYGPDHSEARKIYIYCMLTSVMAAGNSLWVKFNSNPSGQITTCHLNSTVNTYYQAVAYKTIHPPAMIQDFHADIRHRVCGDDILAASKVATFNFNSVQAVLKTHDIVFSVGNKNLEAKAPDFTPHELMTYLKAHFYFSETFKGFVAYVDDAQLHKQLVYCRDSSLQGQKNLALSVLHTAQMHGDIRCRNAPLTDMLYPQWVEYIRRFIPDIDAPSMSTVVADYHRYAPTALPPVEIVEEFDDQGDFEIIEIMQMDDEDSSDDELHMFETDGTTSRSHLTTRMMNSICYVMQHKNAVIDLFEEHLQCCDECYEAGDLSWRDMDISIETYDHEKRYVFTFPCDSTTVYHGTNPADPDVVWFSCDGVHFYVQNEHNWPPPPVVRHTPSPVEVVDEQPREKIARLEGNIQTSVTNNTVNGNGNTSGSGSQGATATNDIKASTGAGHIGGGGKAGGAEDIFQAVPTLGLGISGGPGGITVSGSASGSHTFGKRRGNATPLPPGQRTNVGSPMVTMEPMPGGVVAPAAVAGGTTDQPNHTFVPLQVDAPTLIKSTLNGVDQANVLGDIAANADCASYGNFNATVDEMTKEFYTNHFSYLYSIPIGYDVSAQTHLGDIDMHPFQLMPRSIPATGGVTDDFSLTRLEQWCANFEYWQGPIEIRFHLAAPRETALRMAFVLAYNDFGVAPTYSVAVTGPTVIVDFDECKRDHVIRIPFVSTHEWLVPFYRDQNSGVLGKSTDYSSMGTFRIYLSTRVAGNTAVYTQNPQMHVYIRGPGMKTKRFMATAGLAPEGHFLRSTERIKEMQGDQGTTVTASVPPRAMVPHSGAQRGRLVPIKLSDFAAKWVTAAVATVTTSSQPTLNFRHPDDTLLAQANYAQSAMRYYRGTLVVRVTPVASGWVGGHYIMYWAPYCSVGYYTGDLTNCTNLDYVIIDLASNQAVEFEIPYRFHREFFTRGQQDMFGHINIEPLGVFQGATTGTSSVDLEIQFAWKNFESYVPAEIALTMSGHETIAEIQAASEEAEVVTAALTTLEVNSSPATAPIDNISYGSDHREINHLSDLLKRMTMVDVFLEDHSSGNTTPYYTLHEAILWKNSPLTVLTMNYSGWVGDRVVQFIRRADFNTRDIATGTQVTEDAVKVFLFPGVDTPSQQLYPRTADIATLTGFPYAAYSPLPNHGIGTAFNRNTYGMVPLLETTSHKNRVVIPFHCPNKFVVYAQNPDDLDGPPLVDQFSQGLLVYTYANDALPGQINIKQVEVYHQYGDGFRMSHYRPRKYSLSGVTVPPSVAYGNYFGQYFASTA